MDLLAFCLGTLGRYRTEISRGRGAAILPMLLSDLDDQLGIRRESAFGGHVRRMELEGTLGPEIIAVGPYWCSEA